ncbi:hypothetical protein OG921_05960 [Aldersonia sp. NBC_00410]|uniref:hypothetical protein n=1 Tax=Aldersonia sp. NBC_00410 TaxID=2975954 RepID=UPI00225A68F5|nr:hypothetical protein [Aldersonia sp. NBC_00410]MCX5042711.1 hypothetical protein [Aldersonia sp. NBC_00410]
MESERSEVRQAQQEGLSMVHHGFRSSVAVLATVSAAVLAFSIPALAQSDNSSADLSAGGSSECNFLNGLNGSSNGSNGSNGSIDSNGLFGCGRVCDDGITNLAYNALPFGAVNCAFASYGFEAQRINEMGDAVGLAGTAKKLVSMDVLFASWACETNPDWQNGCVTTLGTTFDVPITAKIYAENDLTKVLAEVIQTKSIPYRPSADDTKCTGTNAGKFFNPDGPPGLTGSLPDGGRCQNYLGTMLTFTFPAGITLPDRVVWTVAFNTTHSGYAPIGESPACYTAPQHCGYDSLNVGAMDFPNAPYAGTDLAPDQTAYFAIGADPLKVDDTGTFRPLGAITTTR